MTAQHDEIHLASRIRDAKSSADAFETDLKTDARVISRVTDGIYRQPASAIRELISNAYDADATKVTINTDAPRFSRITVDDDGHGMSPEALAHVIEHIGGSAKRNESGASLGVTDANNPFLSPGGRRLIGKIGIGLFSVSQLTRSFQIVTKVKGDNYRTVATVSLRQFSDEHSEVDNKEFESGKVAIWREPAQDVQGHGTLVVLNKIRPQAVDVLRSRDLWAGIDEAAREEKEQGFQVSKIERPVVHIGKVDAETGDYYTSCGGPETPWEVSDSPNERFKKLVYLVWDQYKIKKPNPKIEKIFDYYFQMLWQLSLSLPLRYVGKSPFDVSVDDPDYFYRLSNDFKKGAASRLSSEKGATARSVLDLKEVEDPVGGFDVDVDEIRLFRPIRTEDMPSSNNKIKHPMYFYGKCEENFDGYPVEITAGSLKFYAYMIWNSKMVPTEHRGALIRVHGASGTLFDSSFMRYQTSETTRLSQLTCEIFVEKGLESALNIDRESFNAAHPHVVYITKWLHSAIKQFATANKRIGQTIRKVAREQYSNEAVERLSNIAMSAWIDARGDDSDSPPEILFEKSNNNSAPEPDSIRKLDQVEAYSFSFDNVIASSATAEADEVVVAQMKGVAQILAAYGLLDDLPLGAQEKLLSEICKVLTVR